MIGFSPLSNLFTAVWNTGLVTKIFHSVLITKNKDGHIKPVAPVAGSYQYVGVEDTEGFTAYCRQAGDVEILREEPIGAALRYYHLQIPHRMVFFNQHETRTHEDITALLLKAVMSVPKDIRLRKAITMPVQLLQQESPTGKFTFEPGTYYAGIEFFVLLKIQADTCPQEIKCAGIPNPFCGSFT
jgi:hypothetical protein